MPMKLDEIDKKILRALQRNGRIANNDLAREVGLSPSPCLRRVKLLEEAGVIDRYVAVLNRPRSAKG
ncbi:AsnC family transcriptional regulator [Brucella melitensis]|nr:AsnC family transcriptional regulator [Brucella melitensis]